LSASRMDECGIPGEKVVGSSTESAAMKLRSVAAVPGDLFIGGHAAGSW
jgi:hypothetical protein